MRRILVVVIALLFAFSLASSTASAKGHRADENGPASARHAQAAHTITWWCVDLNELWHVGVPLVVGRGVVIPPDPSPIANPCVGTFPSVVPSGSAFVPGAGAVWYTNKTYPPAVRAALEATGYAFHSQSPAEDFMSKMAGIRVEVRDFADPDVLVAVFHFDPRQNFRLVRARDFHGQIPVGPIQIPALGIDISEVEAGRLPLFGFPVVAGPVPPGEYRAWVYWVLSDTHNDGLGLDDLNFLPAGETLLAAPRFIVAP